MRGKMIKMRKEKERIKGKERNREEKKKEEGRVREVLF
jgi:hypothetical protein